MIFKKFFSRMVIFALLVIIEVAFIALTLSFFAEHIYGLRVACVALAALATVFIVNKDQTAEIKLPWILLMAITPAAAIVVYAVFANARFNSRHRKSILLIDKEVCKFLTREEKEEREKAEFLGDFAGIEKYISAQTHNVGALNDKTDFFPSGEPFFESMKKDLLKAERFIFIEYFIIEKGVIWDGILEILTRKLAEGVEVRIMYDDIGCAGKLKNSYCRLLNAAGFKCRRFNTVSLKPSGIFNNRDHRKITVIDGKVGYMGGINLADEYANLKSPFGYWKDTGIRIEGASVKNLTAMFLAMFDFKSPPDPLDYQKYFPKTAAAKGEGYIIPFGCGPIPPYDKDVGENVFLTLINSAKSSLYITTPYLIADRTLISALRCAALKGVDVRIVTPKNGDKKITHAMTRSTFKTLLADGVKIYEYTPGFIHAKQILADDDLAFIGTINLDYRSLAHHFECGAVTYKTPCVQDIKKDFEEIFAAGSEITEENYKMNPVVRLLLSVIAVFRPLF